MNLVSLYDPCLNWFCILGPEENPGAADSEAGSTIWVKTQSIKEWKKGFENSHWSCK
jgi:hypothetical protein